MQVSQASLQSRRLCAACDGRSGATTGAWPGIQTFGGRKNSGVTGRNGFGPHYLPQFMREQSHTLMEV
jgi:delta 1-pyrroline-5-carboxylate dehydrogenase